MLPIDNTIPINKLAAVFNNTSATYKFYWFLAIVEAVESGQISVSKRELFSRMVANAWFTVNYFKISFGKQDLIQQAVYNIKDIEDLPIDLQKEKLLEVLLQTSNLKTLTTLWHFNKNVPHWFLSPWFNRSRDENDSAFRKRIYLESRNPDNNCLYTLDENSITINSGWQKYIQNNAAVLKAFVFWNLALFLQVRNPNIPDIPNKLYKPPFRGTLSVQRKNYWDIVFRELGQINCIFTDQKLTINKYALDHFVPHAFVSHNLLWNLAPIDVSFNAFKSDKLPSMELHFDKFYHIQKIAYEIISHQSPKSKLLEEYLYMISKEKDKIHFGYTRFRDTIAPLISIAGNNGFQSLYNNIS
jgi:hypothetical protein